MNELIAALVIVGLAAFIVVAGTQIGDARDREVYRDLYPPEGGEKK